jgi:poly(A) polymerase
VNAPTSPSLRDAATEIVRRLQAAGFRAYWVGGCVRDSLLGREPGDYDVATNARAEEIEKLFPHTIPVGRQFGVVVVVEAGANFQVATFRAESGYTDGRRPSEVTFGDPQADASRRDFTINGLFLDPLSGETHDWVGGKADLQARLVRTIGSPEERFVEDHLRMLRAVRFAAQLDFTIAPETFAAIQSLAPKIKIISAERIRDELLKMFTPGIAERGLRLLHASGLMVQVFPELSATVACEQPPEHHPEGTVFEHLCLMLRHLPDDADPLLPWAVLLHDIAKPVTATRDATTGAIHFYKHDRIGAEMTERILGALRFPRKQVETVATVVRHHMQFVQAREMRKATLRRLFLRPTFALEMGLHRLDCLGSTGRLDTHDFLVARHEEFGNQPEVIPPLVDGAELIQLGMKPGPVLGAMLAEIREMQLADELTTKQDAITWAATRIKAD